MEQHNQNLNHTLENVFDKIIQLVVMILLPDNLLVQPLLRTLLAHKWLLLGMCGMIILTVVPAFMTLLSGKENWSLVAPNAGVPQALKGYREAGFNSNISPLLSPFGGDLSKYSQITAAFHDQNYFNNFHSWHQGVDLIPNQNYYNNNEAYKLFQDVVLFATCEGKARSGIDGAGANYIVIFCADRQYAVLLVHNKQNFIPLGSTVAVYAGEPVAVMGNTGHSTGAHVHYAIKNLKNGKYEDPLVFIDPP